MLQWAVNSTASRQFRWPNTRIVKSPWGDTSKVASVPIHSAGPSLNRQCTVALGSTFVTSKSILPISLPAGSAKRTVIDPPCPDVPVVLLVHQPATPATVDTASTTFATGALMPIL